MNECLKCKYEVLINENIQGDWNTAAHGHYSYPRGYQNYEDTLSNGARAVTVAKHDKATWGPQYSEDEYEQGSEFDIFVVIKVEDAEDGTLYFRKSGKANSYADESWNGLFTQVKSVKKEVTVFENFYEVV